MRIHGMVHYLNTTTTLPSYFYEEHLNLLRVDFRIFSFPELIYLCLHNSPLTKENNDVRNASLNKLRITKLTETILLVLLKALTARQDYLK